MRAAKCPFQEIDFRAISIHINISKANKSMFLLIPTCKTQVNIFHVVRSENRFAKQFDHQKYFL